MFIKSSSSEATGVGRVTSSEINIMLVQVTINNNSNNNNNNNNILLLIIIINT